MVFNGPAKYFPAILKAEAAAHVIAADFRASVHEPPLTLVNTALAAAAPKGPPNLYATRVAIV